MALKEVAEFLKDVFKYVLIILIMVIIFMFVVSFQPVSGNSMYPTVEGGNVVVVTKLMNKYERNSIIIFKDKENKSYIKRIIGLPGEEIHYLDNILYINGNPFKESFINKDVKTYDFSFEEICSNKECPKGVIPEDMYLVLGDNREGSKDSRDPKIGLISKKQIGGIVRFRIWPINKIKKIA